AGAGEGLNRFNGNTVTRYLSQDYPQLANNNIQGLVCDEDNRIWIRCDDGAAAMADGDRRFHKLDLQYNNKPVTIKRILKTDDGIILLTSNGFYAAAKNITLAKNDAVTLNNFLPLAIILSKTAQNPSIKVEYQVGKFNSRSTLNRSSHSS
ncbi:MAG: hypothetical protein RLZZ69_1578, partial [Cyanobacteriota bacterium]